MRAAAGWMLTLALACVGTAQSQAGATASGTVTLVGPRGNESGTITVSAWGEDHCKVTIALGPPILRRSYTAVMNGNRVVITAPAGMAAAAPLPVGPRMGCALLTQGLAYDKLAAGESGAASLSLDAAGRPGSLSWTDRGRPASLGYAQYQVTSGLLLPASVTETVAGRQSLRVQFDSIAASNFTDADFPLPPAPPRPAPKSAGGAQ
ncbi:MAG: hypothetical protein ACRD1L_03605 [Terriglobales bacterium]